MSKADDIFKTLENLKISELLVLCANAYETNLDKMRLDALLLLLETKLQKRRLCEQLGIKEREK